MNIFKQLKISESLTSKEIADKIGISQSLYQKLEGGFRTPSANVIKKIKLAFPYFDINIFFE